MSMIDAEPVRPDPGVYRGVTFGDYCRWDALNFHTLVHYAKSPMQARHKMLRGDGTTDAKQLGDGAHAAVLQPDVFAERYVECPNFGAMQSSTNRAKRDAWINEQEAADKIILMADEYRHAKAIRRAIEAHPLAADLLLNTKGQNELSFVWEQQGQLCKGRCDRLCQWHGESWIVDLKTTRNVWPDAFARDAAKFMYRPQLATYRAGLARVPKLPSIQRKACIVAIQSDEPYEVGVFWLGETELNREAKRFDAWLVTHKRCVETGNWPGANPDGMDLILPKWADADLGDWED